MILLNTFVSNKEAGFNGKTSKRVRQNACTTVITFKYTTTKDRVSNAQVMLQGLDHAFKVNGKIYVQHVMIIAEDCRFISISSND